ncbi:MAG: PHP domain-containing protein, partial [Gammaproteobacteria bacterium]|nr:PHP domain-containing protein [Gammaproteobacteria bacterium]
MFHLVKNDNLGFSLLTYTGSNEHINSLNAYAEKNTNLNCKNENSYKLFLGDTEEKIYNKLKLPFIPPELRENRGEIIVAKKNMLPNLITLNDIKGDLHSHTNETDGIETLAVMVAAAFQKGYEYFAITDHSKRLAITNGLNEKRLLKQIELINKLNLKYTNIKILKSIEVDILEDGKLDLSNDVLKELDICVCSLHSKFKLPADKQTERIIRAMDNPYFNILGHMTGRLLTSRPPYFLDVEKIFSAAKERGCFIELNCQPARLDINDIYCKRAKEVGVKIAISSDAHSVRELSFMEYGINQAR